MSKWSRATPLYASSSGNVTNTASCGGGANGVINFAAPASTNTRNYLSDVVWSYSTTPGTGGINIYDGTSSGALMLKVDINGMGPDSVVLSGPLGATPGRAMAIELLQAGSSIIGRLNAYGFRL